MAKRILPSLGCYVVIWVVWAAYENFFAGTLLVCDIAVKIILWFSPFAVLFLRGENARNDTITKDLLRKPFPWMPCVVALCLTVAILHTLRLINGLQNTYTPFDPAYILLSASAGVVEEVSFRGYFFKEQEAVIGCSKAAVINGFLFMFYHFPKLMFGEWRALVSVRALFIFFMGIAFCMMFHRWRNLTLNIIVHTVWDFLSYMFCLAG